MATPNIFQGTRLPQHGMRQQLQGIASQGNVRTSALPQRAPRVAAAGAQQGLDMGSPLQKLRSLPPSNEPITAGLGVGPGEGPSQMPMSEEQMFQLDRMQKLAAVAQFAKTPHLRRIASALLRSMAVQTTGRPIG